MPPNRRGAPRAPARGDGARRCPGYTAAVSESDSQALVALRAPEPVRPGENAVYAAAAGVLSSFPVPWIDTILGEAARGAVMRRVAARHGVRLTREAREELSRVTTAIPTGRGARVARHVLLRFASPLRLVSRAEDAVSVFVAADLFDHYLRTSGRRPGAPVTGLEAARVRRAVRAGALRGVRDAIEASPGAGFRHLKATAGAVRRDDPEDRSALARVIDTFLDGLAGAPGAVTEAMASAFDDALAAADDEDLT